MFLSDADGQGTSLWKCVMDDEFLKKDIVSEIDSRVDFIHDLCLDIVANSRVNRLQIDSAY
jgi:hypothetical protein